MYHESIYNRSVPAASYWEATLPESARFAGSCCDGDITVDVAVVGGGYTGLSAGLQLARQHAVDVCVLEAGSIGWGASGRNGGFVCLYSSKLGIAELVRRSGEDEARKFFASQIAGGQYVDDLASEFSMDIDRVGTANIDVAHAPSRVDALRRYGDDIHRLSGLPVRFYDREAFAASGHTGTEQFGALETRFGGAIHPQKFVHALANASAANGVKIFADTPVSHWQRDGSQHVLRTPRATIRAKRVLFATNGYVDDASPGAIRDRVIPVISNIIVTAPLDEHQRAAHAFVTNNPICNTRSLLFYYRLLPDNRLLFGARGDMTGRPRDAEKMQTWLTRRLGEVFPHWQGVPIDYCWRGLVAMTTRKMPMVGLSEDDPSTGWALGWHANGVNTAPWMGAQMADVLVGAKTTQSAIPALMQGVSGLRLPGAPLRRMALRSMLMTYRVTDSL